jgi:peptidoglycan pentaglycine glycine transferase (the first glycine)
VKALIIAGEKRREWNDFVVSSPYASILQSYEWGEVKKAFGWQPIRIALEDPQGKITAGISILKREVPLIKHALFYAPRGPIVNFKDKDLLHILLEAVEREAEKNHAISLKIDPAIDEEDSQSGEVFKALGFEKALKEVQPRATFLLDLTPDLEQILMSFEEKTSYNVRLAVKKGVKIIEDASQNGIDHFYRIYQETAARDKFLIHPRIYYEKIRELVFAAGLGTTFIAYYEDKPIAAVMIFNFGDTAWYMYGASGAEYRNVMPNHLLHWEIIKWAKNKGLKTYDLWGIPAKIKPEHPLFGVYRFKKGFNGKPIKYIGALDFPYSPLFYHGFEYGIAFWQGLRNLIAKGKIEDSLGE